MIIALIIIFVIVFIELFVHLKIISIARNLLNLSSKVVKKLSDKSLNDIQKEKIARESALAVFKETIKFLGLMVLIGAVMFGLYHIVVYILPNVETGLLESAYTVDGLLEATMIAMLYLWIRNVIRKRL